MDPAPKIPEKTRTWRLWQVESSLACTLDCIMCPWTGERQRLEHGGLMQPKVWQALSPHLGEVSSVDFSGGGEPLLQPCLFDWIGEAGAKGCETGFLTSGLLLSEAICRRVLALGLSWIGFSVDGADKATYDTIRRGSDFDIVCRNIRRLTRLRPGRKPLTMINFVIMESNSHQMEAIIGLAQSLGIDQVNFKQCDVIRGGHGKEHGLFATEETRQVRQLKKALAKARRQAKKLKIKTTAFSFTPEELPVCGQDPRSSLFIGYDGRVSTCINLALGGRSTFLGKEVVLPCVSYGRLPQTPLHRIWEGPACTVYRNRFSQRVWAHDQALNRADIGHDLIKLKQAFEKAIQAMPQAPEGCRTCHYLYDI